MTRDTDWQKATKSAAQGDCVEMRRHHGTIQVRDSKAPNEATLTFAAGPLAAWLAGACRGEYDHLAATSA